MYVYICMYFQVYGYMFMRVTFMYIYVRANIIWHLKHKYFFLFGMAH